MISLKAINIPDTGIHSIAHPLFLFFTFFLQKRLWERETNSGSLVSGISFLFQGNNFINKSYYLGIWESSRKKQVIQLVNCEALLI